MWKFFGFLLKLKLMVLIGAVIVYLLTLPPERRAGQLRTVSIEALRNIEGLAEWGRESLTEGVPPASDGGVHEAQPDAGLLRLRRMGTAIPDDVRVQLQAELVSLKKALEAQTAAGLPSFRRTGTVIPDDFRRQLQAEVAAFDVPALTDWWARLRLEAADSNLDPDRRRDLVKAVVSLAHLLPREVWLVDHEHVPTRGLAEVLAEYNRPG